MIVIAPQFGQVIIVAGLVRALNCARRLSVRELDILRFGFGISGSGFWSVFCVSFVLLLC